MATSNTKICNMALGRIGESRINDFEDTSENSTEAIQCRLHYEQTRDALLKSFYWPFAGARAELSQDTTDPAFEWDAQFILPDDYLYLRSIYDGVTGFNSKQTYTIEGERFLSNDSVAKIRYTKKVIDPSKFDPLFIEVLTLNLADKFIGPLAGGDAHIQEKIDRTLNKIMPKVRAVSRQEANLKGRADHSVWNDRRHTNSGRIDSQMGSD